MIKYEYKKPKGCDSKKFIENGHTMFEEDVLSRLNRLAHLEHKLQNQANGVNTESQALHIDSVMPRFSVSLVYQNVTNIMLRCLILNAKDKSNALIEAMEHFEKEAEGMGLVLKTVIELNEA